jgi:5-formyltetrahydrofolate cyclo-ligase
MKKELRSKFLNRRNSLSCNEVNEKSTAIMEKLFSLPEFIKAGAVMFYVSFQNEVRTDSMIREALKNKRVLVPAVAGTELDFFEIRDYDNSLEKGKYGIPEPKDRKKAGLKLEAIELAIVPGVVFDKQGGRIGFGMGYYDRFLRKLKKLNPGSILIGLAFNMQVMEKFHTDEHDVKMDKIITETNIWDTRAID